MLFKTMQKYWFLKYRTNDYAKKLHFVICNRFTLI